jgi:glycosyltransferase involved in cell wall biosynthesis
LAAVFNKLETDVVLAEFGEHAVAFLEPCRLARVPLVVHFHGYDIYSQPVLVRNEPGYERLFREVAAMVVVSRDMLERMKRLTGSEDRIILNSCGVDVEQFMPTDPAKNPPLFVGVGRFVDKKAPYLTIVAFAETMRACPEAKLILAGDGPLLDCCKQLAQALGVAHSVTFLGTVDHATVRGVLKKARAFVQHSVTAINGDSEGTPVAVLEAAATALPVVSTRHGGIVDAVIHGETGFLVDERDIHGMAQHMTRLGNDPEVAANMGRRARQHIVENYSMRSSINGLSRILSDAVRQYRLKKVI